jgi:cytochrome c oxidase assembly protein subunit 11
MLTPTCRLLTHRSSFFQVDMPVFFYIDPEFLDDPALYKVDTITLSYTFFQAKEAQDLGIQ